MSHSRIDFSRCGKVKWVVSAGSGQASDLCPAIGTDVIYMKVPEVAHIPVAQADVDLAVFNDESRVPPSSTGTRSEL